MELGRADGGVEKGRDVRPPQRLEELRAAAGGALRLAGRGGAVEQGRADVVFEALELLDERGDVECRGRLRRR